MSRYNINMPLKVKIFRISIYYLMYKHLYNMALILDVAFLLSVSIKHEFGEQITRARTYTRQIVNSVRPKKGLRQGDNICPDFFNIFINDLLNIFNK